MANKASLFDDHSRLSCRRLRKDGVMYSTKSGRTATAASN